MATIGYGSGAAESLEQILATKFREALLRDQLSQQQQQAEQAHQRGMRGLDLTQRGQNIDMEQFGQSMGQRDKEFGVTSGFKEREVSMDEGAQPARLRLMGAQAGDIERRPEAEQTTRDFTSQRDATLHGYDMRELGAAGAQQERMARLRMAGEAQGGTPATSPYAGERATRIAEAVDALMPRVSGKTAGWGSLMSGIPASKSRDFAADLDQLKSNIGFSELTEMREASKTGGALGQVALRELDMLQAALGSLDAGQSPENLKKNLQKVRDISERWQAAKRGVPVASPQADPGGGGAVEFDFVPGKGFIPRGGE